MIQKVKHTTKAKVLLHSIRTKITSVFSLRFNETNITSSDSAGTTVKKTGNTQKPSYRYNYFAGPHCYF